MQTFLPYPSFTKSARALDRARLGKQRVEALQLCNALLRQEGGWYRHAAARMWQGHELALARYGMTICKVWIERGYRDTCYGKIRALFAEYTIEDLRLATAPLWVGDPDFHRSHQSNLIRKDPDYYGPQFPGVPDDLPYIWPVDRSFES